jgi:hypothetical protein
MVWALGRIGQRVPVYGPLNTVVPAAQAARWLGVLCQREAAEDADRLAVMQLARRTDDRHRDLEETARQAAVAWLDRAAAPPHLIELVRDGGRLDRGEQGQIVGESLPRGLRVM